jgi:hypothetical protein
VSPVPTSVDADLPGSRDRGGCGKEPSDVITYQEPSEITLLHERALQVLNGHVRAEWGRCSACSESWPCWSVSAAAWFVELLSEVVSTDAGD